MMTRSRRSIGGFSLPELLTALVLVTVAAGAAVPRMTNYVDSIRTRRALDQIVADIAFARMLAIQSGRHTSVQFRPEGHYTVDTLSATGAWGTVRTVRIQEDFKGVITEPSASQIQFSSRGLVTNFGDGMVRTRRGAVRDSMFLSQSGRIFRAY